MIPIPQINKLVKKHLGTKYDIEAIAAQILSESLANGVDWPSREFIRHRCYDVLRRTRREERAMVFIAKPSTLPSTSHQHTQNQDEVNKLIQVLSALERQVVYARFYEDMTLLEISKSHKLPLNKVREVLAVALYKMHQEVQDE